MRASSPESKRWVPVAVFVLGATATITQLVMMREMMCAFSGNELVLGIVLGNWLLLTGLGAWAGRWSGRLRKPATWLVVCLVGVLALPWVQVAALQTLQDDLFGRGITVGIAGTVLGSLGFLAPFCLLSGFMLTLASRMFEEDTGVGRVYVGDTAGSILGGVAFMLALALGSGLGAGTDRVRGESPYGRLEIARHAGQVTFIENSIPVFSTPNIEHIEETVHYAMCQRPGAKRVLLIGGGVSGTAKEILKYSVDEITYVELDPLIIEAGKRFLPENLADPRIKIVNTDGRLFVKEVERASRPFAELNDNGRDARSKKYDIVIVDLPDPSTSQINRFYTAEFFAEVKQILAPGGVLSFAVGRYANYVSPSLARLLATAHATVRTAFRNVQLFPAGRVYFVASDGALTTDIAGRLESARIPVQLMKRAYLDATLTPGRLGDIERALEVPAGLNRDFSPVLYFYQLRHWMSQFPARLGIFAAALGLVLVAYVVLLRPVGLVILAGGFAASALEVVLLWGFQILAGSLYRQVGVIVTVFMAGMTFGAWWANRQRAIIATLPALVFAVAGLAAVLPWALRGLTGAPVWGVHLGVALLTFVLAMLVGMEFPVAARARFEGGARTASRLYSADFVGACLGALLASTLLIPVIGVTATCLLTAGLNLLAGAMLIWRRP